MDITLVSALFTKFDWMMVILPAPFFLGMTCDTLAWKFLLPDGVNARYRQLYGAQLAAESVLLSIPGGFAMSDAIKLFILKRRVGVPGSSIVASLAVRHWLLGITQLLFISGTCAMAGIISRSPLLVLYTRNGSLEAAVIVLIAVSILLGAVIRLLVRGTLARSLWTFLYRIPVPSLRRKLRGFIPFVRETDLHLAASRKKSRRHLFAALFLFETLWFADVFESMLAAHVIGIDLSFSNALITEAILSAVRLSVFFLPGGIVVKDLGYAALFAAMRLPVPAATIAAFIVLKRLVSITCIATGYAALLMQKIRLKGGRPTFLRTALANQ